MNWLSDIMSQGLEWAYGITGNYGLAIIVLSLIIKLLLTPLTLGQTKMTKKMQKLNPEIEKIKEKYKNDPEKINSETMNLWRKYKINPIMGCLPVLIQFPFLIAFIGVLRGHVYTGVTQLLWFDVAQPDPYYILPVLSAVTMFLQMKQNSSTGSQQNQIMTYGMPLMILGISIKFSAGLLLYWTVSNLLMIAQNLVVMYLPSPALDEEIEEVQEEERDRKRSKRKKNAGAQANSKRNKDPRDNGEA